MRGPCVDLPGAIFCGSINGNSFLLRGGFLLQLFSLSGLFISYWASGGSGLFGYELQGMNEVRQLLPLYCSCGVEAHSHKPYSPNTCHMSLT